ncbi:MAG TPA: hypothetical protein VIL64_05375 [Solirubrobacteraceae bacterium]
MAVAIRMAFDGMNLDDYDGVCEALNLPADWPDGLLAHGSTDVDGNLLVTDVWESRDKYDSFVESRLQSAIGETLGDRARPPEVTERQLHTFQARAVG